MSYVIGFIAGAICATAVPFVGEWAGKAWAWLSDKVKAVK